MASLIHSEWKRLQNSISEVLYDTPRNNIENNQRLVNIEENILNPIFSKIANDSLEAKDVKDILKDKYASKLVILNTSKFFGAYDNHRMNFKIIINCYEIKLEINIFSTLPFALH
jgi:hypothetical protein